MSYKIAILALVALHALTTTALPPCVCTRNLRPVCGSDGNTYSNECILNCEKYKTGSDLKVEKDGPCTAAEQICVCTFEYKPVCGNDGKTYPNRCALLCERSSIPNIDVVSEGSCSNEPKEPPCICTEEINEVCGSDGNTYGNPCKLNCATAKDSSLKVQNTGRCVDSIKVVNPFPQVPPCICTEELNEVCGSDGKTYANPCLLNCATANNPSLSVQNQGRCVDSIKVVNPFPQVPPCICTEELNEVCGSDGKTYANPCLLNCATANNPSLSVQNQGKCDSVNVVNPNQGDQSQSCTCPRDLKPVCGSDGVTYNNECLLRCAGAQPSLARRGSCRL